MQDRDTAIQYIIAQGPDGLRKVLDDLLEASQKDTNFAAEPHYIEYQLGSQRSLIKVDMSEKPYLFWYCDLMGRAATKAVKDTIADFLWEKCGEKERAWQEIISREQIHG
jgi:hypothetical protein